MSRDEFLNRRLEGGFRRLPVSLLQEGNELFHCGLLRWRKLRNELSEIFRSHGLPQHEKYTPVGAGLALPSSAMHRGDGKPSPYTMCLHRLIEDSG